MNLSSGDILCWFNSDDMYLLDFHRTSERFYGKSLINAISGAAVTINQIDGKRIVVLRLPLLSSMHLSDIFRLYCAAQPYLWTRKAMVQHWRTKKLVIIMFLIGSGL